MNILTHKKNTVVINKTHDSENSDYNERSKIENGKLFVRFY